MEYLGTIIGHEGKGSLIVFLRKKVWALTLIAGCEGDGYEMNSTHSQFSITIILTQKGFDEVDKVINLLVVHRDAGCSPRLSFVCIKGFQPTIKVGSN